MLLYVLYRCNSLIQTKIGVVLSLSDQCSEKVVFVCAVGFRGANVSDPN
jgi:hypothetical protein